MSRPVAGATPAFDSLSRLALHEEVAAQLRRYIVRRELRPGDRLPSEAELADGVGTSRVVVREALRSLEALGLVESRAGSGRYLRGFDYTTAARTFAQSLAFHPTALLDLLTVRRGAEAELAVEVAGKLSADDFAALDDLIEQMRRRADRGESNFPVEDAAFHRRLVAASGNLVALALVDLYWRVMEELYLRGFPQPTAHDSAAVIRAHAAIVEALRRGDGEGASRLVRAHHAEAERRFAAWREAEEPAGPAGGAGLIQAAVQAALLWPGIGPSSPPLNAAGQAEP